MATATATTASITRAKFSVQPAMAKIKTQSLIPSGTAATTTGLAKNVTAYAKHQNRKTAVKRQKVKVNNREPCLFETLQPGGVVVKHRGLWSP